MVVNRGLEFATASQLRTLLDKKEISAKELTTFCLKRASEVHKKTNFAVSINHELAMQSAEKADELISQNKTGFLTGIPIVIKDLIVTKGTKTTAGSKMLENYESPYNATVIEKIDQECGVIIAKSNLDEFAMGSSNETSYFGAVKNPWDLKLTPGGSSGGSAVAVAAGVAPIALGSDTGGSIRQPAAFCGILALKPTYGTVSRYGLIAFASSLDQIGPFAHSVEDLAETMNVIAGYDSNDMTSSKSGIADYRFDLNESLSNYKFGIPNEYLSIVENKAVLGAFEEALYLFEKELGQTTTPVSLPSTEIALAVYYIIAPAEASANLARYNGIKYGFFDEASETSESTIEASRTKGFGAEVKRRIMIGTYVLSAGYYDKWYKKAVEVRGKIINEFVDVFKKVDFILTPTTPNLPFKIDEIQIPLQMYRNDVCTLPVNIAGLPAIAIPAGFYNGLPVSIQIIGNYNSEQELLKVAKKYLDNTGWHNQHPNF